jgi:hypothetical protein
MAGALPKACASKSRLGRHVTVGRHAVGEEWIAVRHHGDGAEVIVDEVFHVDGGLAVHRRAQPDDPAVGDDVGLPRVLAGNVDRLRHHIRCWVVQIGGGRDRAGDRRGLQDARVLRIVAQREIGHALRDRRRHVRRGVRDRATGAVCVVTNSTVQVENGRERFRVGNSVQRIMDEAVRRTLEYVASARQAPDLLLSMDDTSPIPGGNASTGCAVEVCLSQETIGIAAY